MRRVLLRIAQTMLMWTKTKQNETTTKKNELKNRNPKIHLALGAVLGLIWMGAKGYLWEKYHINKAHLKAKPIDNHFMGREK